MPSQFEKNRYLPISREVSSTSIFTIPSTHGVESSAGEAVRPNYGSGGYRAATIMNAAPAMIDAVTDTLQWYIMYKENSRRNELLLPYEGLKGQLPHGTRWTAHISAPGTPQEQINLQQGPPDYPSLSAPGSITYEFYGTNTSATSIPTEVQIDRNGTTVSVPTNGELSRKSKATDSEPNFGILWVDKSNGEFNEFNARPRGDARFDDSYDSPFIPDTSSLA
jgi:hypothetical protein